MGSLSAREASRARENRRQIRNAALRGVVTLSASTQGAAVAKVVFARKPSGGTDWSEIETDAAGPWSAAFDTRSVPDGLYDLRAQATDANGAVRATHTREGIRVDNTAPALISTNPCGRRERPVGEQPGARRQRARRSALTAVRAPRSRPGSPARRSSSRPGRSGPEHTS